MSYASNIFKLQKNVLSGWKDNIKGAACEGAGCTSASSYCEHDNEYSDFGYLLCQLKECWWDRVMIVVDRLSLGQIVFLRVVRLSSVSSVLLIRHVYIHLSAVGAVVTNTEGVAD